MRQMRGAQTFALTLLLAFAGPAMAQQSTGSTAAALAKAFGTIASDLKAAAENMPADSYGFRPIAGVRSFGQIVAHVSGGHFLYCSQATGSRLSPERAKQLNEMRPYSDVETESGARPLPKDELVALLAESIAFCDVVYAGAAGGTDALIGNIAHDNEHYGNLVTYLRLKGLVPPSTERRTRKAP